MKYIVPGTFIINRLKFPDGQVIDDVIGGGSFYAFSGIRFSTEDCLIVSAAGQDFDRYYGRWFDQNRVSKEGVIKRLKGCTYNELIYHEDGRYDAHSVYNDVPGMLFPPNGSIAPSELMPYIGSDTRGMYIGTQMTDEIYSELKQLRASYPKLNIMYEFYPDKEPGGYKTLDDFEKYTDAFTMFSLNRPESYALLGVDNEDDAISRLTDLDMPVYYRVGSKGAYMIDRGKSYFVPMISVVAREKEIDPTGCGNSSTGGAVWAYTEGYDPLMTCIWGNMVAAHTVQQYGPYPNMSGDVYKNAMKKSEAIYKDMK